MFSILTAATLLAAAPTVPDKFDLNCVGTTRTVSDPASAAEPVELRLSIDLKRRLFCYQEEGCETSPIADLSPTTITLVDRRGDLDIRTTVDRASHAYRSAAVRNDADRRVGTLVEVRCKVQPFSPF